MGAECGWFCLRRRNLPGAEALTGKRISELGLTRQLAGEHLVMVEGRQRRLFVNPLHAQVAVDAAEIAAEHTALASDLRVVKLRLLNPEPVKVPE